ncbi:MAG: maleylpyruvate isomerase N-terminal domain-containing protein [Mycobacterium sp.]
MRLNSDDVREVLADAWQRWARRCGGLSGEQWSTPTRCAGWDVRALVAHLCPDPAMFDMLNGAIIDGPAEVTDAADMLRRFNEPDGIGARGPCGTG